VDACPCSRIARRLRRLPRRSLWGVSYPVATTFGARLLGLALLDRRAAGPGLLLPACSSIHTFGMRFALDVTFLDRDGRVLLERMSVPPLRMLRHPGAAAVLERPAQLPVVSCSSCFLRSDSSSTAGLP
jgi:uncharacterized membrane protein (UPF0127 family)